MFNVNYLSNKNSFIKFIYPGTSYPWGLGFGYYENVNNTEYKFKDKKAYNVILNDILKIFYKRKYIFSILYETKYSFSHIQSYLYNYKLYDKLNDITRDRIIYCNYKTKTLNKKNKSYSCFIISRVNENKNIGFILDLNKNYRFSDIVINNKLIFNISYQINDINNLLLTHPSYRFSDTNNLKIEFQFGNKKDAYTIICEILKN